MDKPTRPSEASTTSYADDLHVLLWSQLSLVVAKRVPVLEIHRRN